LHQTPSILAAAWGERQALADREPPFFALM